MSVILPAKNGRTIGSTLAHLRAQAACGELELVLVTEAKKELELETAALEGFNSVRIVEIGAFERLSEAVCAGVGAAAAPVVVLAEDHSYPEPGWAEALIRRHEEAWVGVGPGIVCANPESALGWADLLMGFGPWVERSEATEVDGLPGHSCSYKRDVLLAYGPALGELIEIEHLLHADLRRRGLRLYFEPAARTRHVNITRPSSWIANRFFGGWVFSVLRSGSWPIGRRLVYVLGSPLLPAVRLWRIAPDLRRVARHHERMLRVLPALVAGLVIESAGETIGLVLGRHVRVRKPLDVEIDRLRHVRGSRGSERPAQ